MVSLTTSGPIRLGVRASLASLLLTLAPLVAITTASTTASAATPYVVSSEAGLRYCVNTAKVGCAKAGNWAKGPATMVCWKDQSVATGRYTSKRWFYLTQGSKRGWTHSSWVTQQTTVPNCSTHRGVRAATWAAERVGVVHMTSAEASYIGEYRDFRWSGACAGFSSSAFHFGAKVEPRYRGDAGAMYRAYKSAGRVRSMSSTPSVGSYVFWPNSTAWGHVAIYIGNGYVATTWGLPGQGYSNKRVKIGTIGTAAGWTMPSDV